MLQWDFERFANTVLHELKATEKALEESTPEASADLLVRKHRLLLDIHDLQKRQYTNASNRTMITELSTLSSSSYDSVFSTYESEKNAHKTAAADQIQLKLQQIRTKLDTLTSPKPQDLLDWETQLNTELSAIENAPDTQKYAYLPSLTATATGLKEHDHMIKSTDPNVTWDNFKRDGHILKADGARASLLGEDLRHTDDSKRKLLTLKSIPKLEVSTLRLRRENRTPLLISALDSGLTFLKEEGFDPKGWSKDISIICHGLNNSTLQGVFNRAAGWDEVNIDVYDLGITCCVDGTHENKLSLLGGFLLYVHNLDKKAPWCLQDIYSYLLRLVENGRKLRPTHFNGIVSALAPLSLLSANFLFPTIKTEIGRAHV
jgi:hypothetical protein